MDRLWSMKEKLWSSVFMWWLGSFWILHLHTSHSMLQCNVFCLCMWKLFTLFILTVFPLHLYTLKEHFTSKFKSNSLFHGILSFEATADKVQNVRITKLKACFVVSVLFYYSCLFIMRMWQNLHHFCCEAPEIFFFFFCLSFSSKRPFYTEEIVRKFNND